MPQHPPLSLSIRTSSKRMPVLVKSFMPTLIISVYVMYLHIHKEIVCTCIQNNLYTYMYFTLSMSISISLSIYIYISIISIYISTCHSMSVYIARLWPHHLRTAFNLLGLRRSGATFRREGGPTGPWRDVPWMPWVKGFHQQSQWMSMGYGYLARLWVIYGAKSQPKLL